MTGRRVSISVIVPTLNEAANLSASVRSARAPGVCEVIVVDGASEDGTAEIARRIADRTLVAGRGRAAQMNAGGEAATGDALLFLHADTILPEGFDRRVCLALEDPDTVGGRFDVRLRPTSPLLALTGALINLRSRLTGISTGDQAMFVRRATFRALGGFPLLPLMEDVEFSRRLKRAGKVACLRERVTTSSRRWRRSGVLRTILLMWTLRLLYACGVSAARLRSFYDDAR